MNTTLAADTHTLEMFLSQDEEGLHLHTMEFPLRRVCELFQRDMEGMRAQIIAPGSAENGKTLEGQELILYAQSLASSRENVRATNDVTVKCSAVSDARDVMTHTTKPDGTVSMTFASADGLGKVVSAILCDYLHHVARMHLASFSHKSIVQLIGMTLGKGFVSQTARDIVAKGRTYEITLHLGKTRWSPPPAPADAGDENNDKVLIYYDRTSGVWEILH